LLLYSSEFPPSPSPANNLISIQLDSITLNEIIANAEAVGKVVKKINFRNVNGFEKLVKGESSKFSFFDDDGRSVCDVNCDVRCKQVPMPTIAPPKPFVAKKDSATGPPYLPPVTKKVEATTVRRTTLTTTLRPLTKSTTVRVTTTAAKTTAKQKLTRPTTVFVTRPRTSTPGPAYLPVSKISTVRSSTVTQKSYPPATWPSTTRSYTQTFPTWSPPIRGSTATKFATTTAKYLYKEPSNSLIYMGEAE
jgi:hypothetical protein